MTLQNGAISSLVISLLVVAHPLLAGPIRNDLSAIRRDLGAIAASGAITRADLDAFLAKGKEAVADGQLSSEERAELKAAAEALEAKIPAELSGRVRADVAALKTDVAALSRKSASPEVKAAAQKVMTDLKQIRAGKYISPEEVSALGSLIRSSLSDGTLSPSEQSAIEEMLSELARKVPSSLMDSLRNDVEALKALLEA